MAETGQRYYDFRISDGTGDQARVSLGVKVGDTLHMVHPASGVCSSLVRVGQEEEQQIRTAGESDPADRYKTSH